MEIEGEQIAVDVDGVASALDDADSVIIVPGYGMAVAQAQQSVSELTRRLRAKRERGSFRDSPSCWPVTRAHERVTRRGESSIRYRP